jgi:hypothetical protein
MKKFLAIFLSVIMLLSSFALMASAASTYSVTLPDVEGRVLATADINTDNPITGDPATADYVIYYDSTVYTDLSAIEANTTFEFAISLAEKYDPETFVLFANNQPVDVNELSGNYAIFMDKNIVLTVPNVDIDQNFRLKRFTIVYKKNSFQQGGNPLSEIFQSKEGVKVFTYHLGDPQNAQTLQGVWGEDYYFKVILDEGYRDSLFGVETPPEDTLKIPMGLKAQTSVCECEEVGILYMGERKTLYADMHDSTLDDIEEDSGLIPVGLIFKIDGENVKQNMDIIVSGVYSDTIFKIVSILYRLLRLILSIINNNT